MLKGIGKQIDQLLRHHSFGFVSGVAERDVIVTLPVFTADIVKSLWVCFVYEFSKIGVISGIPDAPMVSVSENMTIVWLRKTRIICPSSIDQINMEVVESIIRPALPRAVCLAIGGPSGVGKTTLLKRLRFSIIGDRVKTYTPYTTRSKRDGEIHGKDYYFVDPKDLSQYRTNPRFINFVEARGSWYWADPVEFFKSRWQEERAIYLSIITQAHEFINKRIIVPDIHWVWLDADSGDLRQRLTARGDTDIEKSLAQNKLLDMQDKSDLISLMIRSENGDFNSPAQEILSFISSQLKGDDT